MQVRYLTALMLTAAASLSLPAQANNDIRVTFAGSMGKVIDQSLGPAFAKQNDGKYEGQGQGAYGMARLLASKKITADVFASITPGPMQILKEAGLIEDAVPVASLPRLFWRNGTAHCPTLLPLHVLRLQVFRRIFWMPVIP